MFTGGTVSRTVTVLYGLSTRSVSIPMYCTLLFFANGFLAVVRIAKKQKGHSARLKDANPGPHSLFSTYYPSNHYPTTYLVFLIKWRRNLHL
jgi:hypothetical protein